MSTRRDAPASVAILDASAAADNTVSRGARVYLLYLAGFTDREGLTYVSRERTAHDLDVTPRTVSRWRSELETGGHIVREDGGWDKAHTPRGVSDARTVVIRVLTKATRALVNRAHAIRWAFRRVAIAQKRWPNSRQKIGDTKVTPTNRKGSGAHDPCANEQFQSTQDAAGGGDLYKPVLDRAQIAELRRRGLAAAKV